MGGGGRGGRAGEVSDQPHLHVQSSTELLTREGEINIR